MSEALIAALTALIDSRIAAAMQGNPAAANPAADPFAGLGGGTAAAAQPVQATPQMIQELITPLVSNDAIKAELSAAMQSMGITGLDAVTPEQVTPLYTKFKAIADKHAQAPAAAAGGAVPSII